MLDKEDMKLRQMAKRTWYNLGDRNTKYFHVCASQRRKKSQTSSIIDNIGRLREAPPEIARAFKQHFEGIFLTSNLSNEIFENCVGTIQKYVTKTMNNMLFKDFTNQEIEVAMKQIGPLKSPCPNGFGLVFIKIIGRLWGVK